MKYRQYYNSLGKAGFIMNLFLNIRDRVSLRAVVIALFLLLVSTVVYGVLAGRF